MVKKKQVIKNGKNNVEIAGVEELYSKTHPKIKIIFEEMNGKGSISQTYPANLKSENSLIDLLLAIYGEVAEEIDTDYLIGDQLTIKVGEVDGEYCQRIVKYYPIDNS